MKNILGAALLACALPAQAIDGVSAELAEGLFKAGFRSASAVAAAEANELAGAASGIGGVDGAQKIIKAASVAAESERKRREEEAARAAAEAEAAAAAAAAAGGEAAAGEGTR